jgi:DNA-binding NarL/FixJ family response regulator
MNEQLTPQATTLIVADDQQLVRAGFRMILDREPDLTVIGEAADGLEALDLARKRSPDVALLDIRMPGMDGLTAARRILAETTTRVVLLTTFDADEYVFEALRAGASGFLLKDLPPEQLCWAVRRVAAGDALLDPSVTGRLILRFAAAARSTPAVPDAFEELTAPRPLQRRDRERTGRRGVHGQDPRGSRPDEARPTRPRAGRRPGL